MSNYPLSTNVQNVTGYVGRNTVLPCWTSIPSSVLEWRRPNRPQYVALHRDGHLDRGNQSPRYENRVSVDDTGLVLRDTEPSDAGTYECRVKARKARHRRRRRGVLQGDPACIIHLNVDSVKNISVISGHDAVLFCQAPRTATVAVLEWTRDDLGPEEYVYLVRDGVPDPTNQHQDFQNRAELSDREMKDGDVTLILKNVTSKDTGTYKCHLKEDETSKVSKRSLIDTEPISVIKLQVVDPVKNISVISGHDAVLFCQAPRTTTVAVLEWNRVDLGPEEYVYLVRDGVPDPTNQHQDFQNRAELSDREMKDGDVTLILKNVTSKDTGTYECRLKEDETSKVSKRSLIDTEPISVIRVQVVDPGDKDEVPDVEGEQPGRGHYGLAAGVAVTGLAVAALGVWRCGSFNQ